MKSRWGIAVSPTLCNCLFCFVFFPFCPLLSLYITLLLIPLPVFPFSFLPHLALLFLPNYSQRIRWPSILSQSVTFRSCSFMVFDIKKNKYSHQSNRPPTTHTTTWTSLHYTRNDDEGFYSARYTLRYNLPKTLFLRPCVCVLEALGLPPPISELHKAQPRKKKP
jgi:hypothetical protein